MKLTLTLLITVSFNICAADNCELRPSTAILSSERMELYGRVMLSDFFGASGPIGDPSPHGDFGATIRTTGNSNSPAYIEQVFIPATNFENTIQIRAAQNFNSVYSPAGSYINFYSLGFKSAGLGYQELRFSASASTIPGNVLISANWFNFNSNTQSIVAIFDVLPSESARITTSISDQSVIIRTNDGTNGIFASVGQNRTVNLRFGSLIEQGMVGGASLRFSSYTECPGARKGESCFK